MTNQNPYATPQSADTHLERSPQIVVAPEDHKKLETVIKDAGQFWIAIILCLFCSAIGAFIVPIWYLVRLMQWNSLAKRYPSLVADSVPPNSIQAKFKSSQWKLIVGIVVGAVVFAFVALYLLLIVVGASVAPQ